MKDSVLFATDRSLTLFGSTGVNSTDDSLRTVVLTLRNTADRFANIGPVVVADDAAFSWSWIDEGLDQKAIRIENGGVDAADQTYSVGLMTRSGGYKIFAANEVRLPGGGTHVLHPDWDDLEGGTYHRRRLQRRRHNRLHDQPHH